MAIAKTEVDLNRALMFKGARAIVRLVKSMEADTLLNDILPQMEAEYNQRVLSGTLPSVAVNELVNEVAERVS